MAERKAPQTAAVSDSSAADNSDKNQSQLPKDQYNRFIRLCFTGRHPDVEQLQKVTGQYLKSLGKKGDPSKAVAKCPDGSDQVNLQAFYTWMRKVQKGHRKAVNQIIAINATASRRLGV